MSSSLAAAASPGPASARVVVFRKVSLLELWRRSLGRSVGIVDMRLAEAKVHTARHNGRENDHDGEFQRARERAKRGRARGACRRTAWEKNEVQRRALHGYLS